MGDLERIEAKVDWCVTALKALLERQAGEQTSSVVTPVFPATEDQNIATGELDEDPELTAMLAQPDPPPAIGCPASPTGTHTSQQIINGNLCCGNCGALLNAGTGIKDTSQGQKAPWLSTERN